MQQILDQHALQLTASYFSTGPVSAIRNRNVLEIASELPDHRQLRISNSTTHYEDKIPGEESEGEARLADVDWVSNPERRSFPPYTLQDLAKTEPRCDSCTTYTTATITASYQQQTAQWKALYLLCGKDVLAVDFVMGDAVSWFWNADVYPGMLLGGIYRRDAAVQEWLNAHASATCTGTQTCFENGVIVIPKEKIPAPYYRSASGNAQ
jgi:hypothetical protein